MTKRTTADWEALLDGWATVAQGANLVEAKAALKRMEEQKRAAPEAVAEVVRLRRAFEAWATQLEELSAEMEAKGYSLNSEQIDAVVAGVHYILEGHNDE